MIHRTTTNAGSTGRLYYIHCCSRRADGGARHHVTYGYMGASALLYFTDVVAYDALPAKMEKSGSIAAIRSKFPIVIPPPWTWRSRSIVFLFFKPFFYAARGDSRVFCSALGWRAIRAVRTINPKVTYITCGAPLAALLA